MKGFWDSPIARPSPKCMDVKGTSIKIDNKGAAIPPVVKGKNRNAKSEVQNKNKLNS
jgi:hypothetical protein